MSGMEECVDADGGQVRMPSAAAADHEADKEGQPRADGGEHVDRRTRVLEGYVDPGDREAHLD